MQFGTRSQFSLQTLVYWHDHHPSAGRAPGARCGTRCCCCVSSAESHFHSSFSQHLHSSFSGPNIWAASSAAAPTAEAGGSPRSRWMRRPPVPRSPSNLMITITCSPSAAPHSRCFVSNWPAPFLLDYFDCYIFHCPLSADCSGAAGAGFH